MVPFYLLDIVLQAYCNIFDRSEVTASMAIIKGVDHLRIEKQKRQKAESIKESKKEVKECSFCKNK